RFQSFVEERRLLGDWADFVSADMTRLSRVKLVEACGIQRSIIYQNAQVVTLLRDLESELRAHGVLYGRSADTNCAHQNGLTHDEEELEQRLGDLSASLCKFNDYLNEVSKSLVVYPLSRPK
ncbi:TPA: hypothetical protein L5X79_006685, partial [Pseudomonas aeruginosa]|nr:hypothetical protein [Pseudomonas aeruginosa]